MSLKDTGNMQIFSTYTAFWPFYLSQHSNRKARLIHVIGTFLAFLATLKGLICSSLMWFILAPVFGYGAAWVAHHFVEKNHPATFSYPLWSFRGDLHMFGLWLTGQLEVELVRYNILS